MKFRYCASVIENSSLWKFFILKILRKSCVSLGNSSLWKFFALKILQKSCVSLGNSSLWYFWYIRSWYRVSAPDTEYQHEILHFLKNSSEDYTLEPDMGYQILIQGIRCWYRVSAPDTKYQHKILHFPKNSSKNEEM